MNRYLFAGTISYGERRVTPSSTPPEGDALLLPKDWKRDGTRRGILYTHAASQRAYHVTSWTVPLVLASHYPLIAIDAGDPTMASGLTSGLLNWGNDNALSRYTDVFNYLTSTQGCKTDKVGVFGGSMGGIQALNWVRRNKSKVACVGLNIPVLDLNDIYVNDKGGYRASIAAAYGVTYPAALPLATNSPVAFAAHDLDDIPIRLWPSDNDSIASTTAVANSFAASGVGNRISVKSTGAQGHNTTNLDPWEVFEWMKPYL